MFWFNGNLKFTFYPEEGFDRLVVENPHQMTFLDGGRALR
jgi:hypothetical protein